MSRGGVKVLVLAVLLCALVALLLSHWISGLRLESVGGIFSDQIYLLANFLNIDWSNTPLLFFLPLVILTAIIMLLGAKRAKKPGLLTATFHGSLLVFLPAVLLAIFRESLRAHFNWERLVPPGVIIGCVWLATLSGSIAFLRRLENLDPPLLKAHMPLIALWRLTDAQFREMSVHIVQRLFFGAGALVGTLLFSPFIIVVFMV